MHSAANDSIGSQDIDRVPRNARDPVPIVCMVSDYAADMMRP